MNRNDSRSADHRVSDAPPPPPTPIRITSGRHPFELSFLLGGLVCGVMMVTLDALPRSLVAAVPATVEWTWEVSLVLAGLVGLLGIGWPGQISTGQGLELGAILLLGANTCIYAIALFVISGEAALAAGTFIGAVSIGCSWRAGQIMGNLRRLAEAPDRRARTGSP
ncbi:hypothetical protein OG792_13780 [Micromonospora sp. NBC_01699]|uniref:hypothetical protein n=1 Tax=Micromonospora sp. NBC_01699 TaxID=2975984 RepID=UPI002E31AC86|nr:hypothetical protein [Micromonospora sp. NBC_01699]